MKKIQVDEATAIHVLENGRIYKTVGTGKPFVDGEYTSGGITLFSKHPENEGWLYIDNCRGWETVENILKGCARNKPDGWPVPDFIKEFVDDNLED